VKTAKKILTAVNKHRKSDSKAETLQLKKKDKSAKETRVAEDQE
jgi:hypothetical protein